MSKRVISIGESDIAYLGVARCLEAADLELVGGPVSAAGALEAVGKLSPELVLIRLIASDVAGYQVCRDITSAFPSLPVILFVIDPDDKAVADAIHAGARACLDARRPCADIQHAILVVLSGGSLFTAEQFAASQLAEPLTRREIEVLELAAWGLALKEIAEELGTSPGTVRNQLAATRAKLGVRTTVEAVTRAQRRCLVRS